MNELEQRVKYLEKALSILLASDRYTFEKRIQIMDGRNIQVGKGTGTQIGTESTQKLGFFGATPIARPSSTGEFNGHLGGAGTTLTHKDTFNGDSVGTFTTFYTINDIVKHLKNLGILTK